MNLSKLESQLIRDEGLRLKPYRDTVGKLTIGIGRNLDDVGISECEAKVMLRNDIAKAKQEMQNFAWFNALNPARKRAILNMHFNLGLGRLLGFKRMISALNRGDCMQAAHEALDSKWAHQVGKRAIRIAEAIRNGTD